MKLYKFKSGNEYDFDALLNNQLWVSKLTKMNDPQDFYFYIDDKNNNVREEDILNFQNYINNQVFCVSCSTMLRVKRLWNYYTDGMRGMVLTYRKDALLKCIGVRNTCAGEVEYKTEKANKTEMFLEFLNNRIINGINLKNFFEKDSTWSEEKEYRIVFEGSSDREGFLLENIIPYEIYVGYKMPVENVERIKEHCQKNKIVLKKYKPNFKSRSGKDFEVEIIYDTDLNSTK